MGKKHFGREKMKVHMTFNFKKVIDLKDMSGKHILIQWRRGTRKKSGSTKIIPVEGARATIDEEFSLTNTIFVNKKTKGVDTKLLSLVLCEYRHGKPKPLSKIQMDISAYSSLTAPETVRVPFANGVLITTVASQPLKMNDKKLEKAKENDPRPVVEVNGEEYALESDSHESETTMDSASVALDDDDELQITPGVVAVEKKEKSKKGKKGKGEDKEKGEKKKGDKDGKSFKFVLLVKKMDGLTGGRYYVRWVAGKKTSGETSDAPGPDPVWNVECSFSTTLKAAKAGGGYQPKPLDLILYEDRSKDGAKDKEKDKKKKKGKEEKGTGKNGHGKDGAKEDRKGKKLSKVTIDLSPYAGRTDYGKDIKVPLGTKGLLIVNVRTLGDQAVTPPPSSSSSEEEQRPPASSEEESSEVEVVPSQWASIIARGLDRASRLTLSGPTAVHTLTNILEEIVTCFEPLIGSDQAVSYKSACISFHQQLFKILKKKVVEEDNMFTVKKVQSVVDWAAQYEAEMARIDVRDGLYPPMVNFAIPLLQKYQNQLTRL